MEFQALFNFLLSKLIQRDIPHLGKKKSPEGHSPKIASLRTSDSNSL